MFFEEVFIFLQIQIVEIILAVFISYCFFTQRSRKNPSPCRVKRLAYLALVQMLI